MKKAYFYIDDVIWCFRDIARQKPKSIYDIPFMGMLKESHDKYGMKVQLNVFLRTDFYYGNDEFYLSEMPDFYKPEFETASDWLKFGFHAKQEFPDYPYVNATYEDVKADFDETKAQVIRFAGEKSFANAVVTHWRPMSKAGCKALYDSGIRLMTVSSGPTTEYTGNPSVLPYGHAGRLLQNRQPETKIYSRGSKDVAIDASITGYNHVPHELVAGNEHNLNYYTDPETGMGFKKFSTAPCLNLSTLAELEVEFPETIGPEYLGYATHEQYFYSDYYNYQPEYPAKILWAAEFIQKSGYEYFFIEEIVK